MASPLPKQLSQIVISTYLNWKTEGQATRDQLLANHITILNATDTLDIALRKFHGTKILSAPVRLQNGGYKVLSILDIVNAIADITNDIIFSVPIEAYCDFSGLADYTTVAEERSLKEAIVPLGEKHRVIVVNDKGHPINVISQMDVVSFVARFPQYIPEKLANVPVGHFMTTNPVCINLNDRVFEAFKLCAKNRYHGIGVCDENGHLVTNLSVSLLKYITPENFQHLMRLSVKKFLEETQQFYKAPVSVNYGETFGNLVKTMKNTHVHRVFILNEGKPVGVVSTSDVLTMFARALQEL